MNTMVDKSTWCREEFALADLGDYRLNERLTSIADVLNQNSGKSIYDAFKDYNSCKGAYRFFSNPKFNAKQVFEPHCERTVERLQEVNTVLVIQDTTTVQFNSHKKMRGLGTIGGTKNSQGLFIHHALVLTPEGIPLGLLHQQSMARREAQKGVNYHNIAIEDKDSYRWIETLRKTEERKPDNVNFIHIADREADFYEFICEAKKLTTMFIIRGKWDRKLVNGKSLLGEIQGKPSAIQVEVPIKANGTRKARTAICEVKFGKVMLQPPIKMRHLSNLEVNVVLVEETSAPMGVKALKWTLLTNIAVDTPREALSIINFYKKRWRIEEFHKILKSAYKIEDISLETAERFWKMLSLVSVLAVRLLWLTYASREAPDLPCELILTESEWKTLYVLRYRKKVPWNKTPFKLEEAVRLIAELGGYRGRKNDPEPGITVVWRGYKRLQDSMETREVFVDANMLNL